MKLNHSLAGCNLFGKIGLSWLLLFMSVASASVASAESLARPTGKILLTVSGDIEVTNSDNGAQFDYEMLSQLGLVNKEIATHWTGPNSIFSGVLTRKLMTLLGARGTWVRAVAANDYSVNIPLTDFTEFETVLAMSQNGERLTLRDKGPLWLLYPNDSRPDDKDSIINRRMVWQLTSLQIR